MNYKGIIITCAVMCATGVAHAGTWSESANGGGDAGPLLNSAQMISGDPGLLTEIKGSHNGSDVDLYKICLDFPNDFSAVATSDNGGPTPMLFLFDVNGIGVKFFASSNPNDPSWFDNQWVVALGAGDYYLGVTTRNATALNDGGMAIWNQTTGAQRQPTGPGGPGPLDSWQFTVGEPTPSNYTIAITGVDYYVPAPGALALLGMGGLLGITRRRRTA